MTATVARDRHGLEVLAGLEGLGSDSWALGDVDGQVHWIQIRAESVTGRAAGDATVR